MGALMKMWGKLLMCIAALSLSGCFDEKGLFLVAEGFVPVYATVEDSLAILPVNSIMKLEPEQKVRVLKRIDVKHYQIYKISLSDGSVGYINEGKYELIRNKK